MPKYARGHESYCCKFLGSIRDPNGANVNDIFRCVLLGQIMGVTKYGSWWTYGLAEIKRRAIDGYVNTTFNFNCRVFWNSILDLVNETGPF